MSRWVDPAAVLERIEGRLEKLDAAIASLLRTKPALAELPKRFVSVRAYSKSRDLSERQTRRMIAEGVLPAVMIGHSIRIPIDEAAKIERPYAPEHKIQLNCGKAESVATSDAD